MQITENSKTLSIEEPRHVQPATIEPESYEAARMERAEVMVSIQQLNYDLESPIRKTRDGRQLTQWEYEDWKTRAQAAKRFKERRLTYLNEWIEVQDLQRPIRQGPLVVSVDRLVGLYQAMAAYLDEETDAAWEKMIQAFDAAEEVME